PLVQQGFENGEVREAHVERLDAARRVPREGAMRFHQHEPGVNGGRISSSWRHRRESGGRITTWPHALTTSILISYSLMSSDIGDWPIVTVNWREMTWRLDSCSCD